MRTADVPQQVMSRSHVTWEMDSHHPLPEHQQVLSGGVLRRNERRFLESPRLNASDNFDAISSSRAPAQEMIITGQTNRAKVVALARPQAWRSVLVSRRLETRADDGQGRYLSCPFLCPMPLPSPQAFQPSGTTIVRG
jgi:hypothetical protein